MISNQFNDIVKCFLSEYWEKRVSWDDLQISSWTLFKPEIITKPIFCIPVKNPPANSGGHKRHGFGPWVGKIPWRRVWQPTPVFLPGESHGQRSLVGYSPRVHKGSDTTEATQRARPHELMWNESQEPLIHKVGLFVLSWNSSHLPIESHWQSGVDEVRRPHAYYPAIQMYP